MLSIGEFSLTSRLSIKALRYYHDLGILIPCSIDGTSGYRYYDGENLRRAEEIKGLKELGFSMGEIQEILKEDGMNLQEILERKELQIQKKLESLSLQQEKIRQWKEGGRKLHRPEEESIREVEIPELQFLAFPIMGSYEEIGRGFELIYKKAASYVEGPSFALHHQLEYRETGAQMDACAPAYGAPMIRDLEWRTLPPQRGVSLIHRGPYPTLGNSYERLFNYCREREYTVELPIREIYLKGPGWKGMGDPNSYITEIQLRINRP